jgi:hypothetical protein
VGFIITRTTLMIDGNGSIGCVSADRPASLNEGTSFVGAIAQKQKSEHVPELNCHAREKTLHARPWPPADEVARAEVGFQLLHTPLHTEAVFWPPAPANY